MGNVISETRAPPHSSPPPHTRSQHQETHHGRRREAGRDRQEEGRGAGPARGPGRWQEGKEGFHDPREEEEIEASSEKKGCRGTEKRTGKESSREKEGH